MRRTMLAIAAAAIVVALATTGVITYAAGASNRSKGVDNRVAKQYVGYWMGVDPLDGGDSRRAITSNDDGAFALIGRDTVFTLCDNTDRAVITATLVVDDTSLRSDDLVIACTNLQSTVHLAVRYDVIDRNIIREHVTTPQGAFVDEIVFHRVSA